MSEKFKNLNKALEKQKLAV